MERADRQAIGSLTMRGVAQEIGGRLELILDGLERVVDASAADG